MDLNSTICKGYKVLSPCMHTLCLFMTVRKLTY